MMVTANSQTLTVTLQRKPLAIVGAWLSGLLMLAAATSVAALFVAPVAVPAATWVVARLTKSWALRVPLIVGAIALILLFGAWLVSGAGFGSTTNGGSSS